MKLYISPASSFARKIRVMLLEKMLGGRDWCVGDRMSLADIAVGAHLGFISLRFRNTFRTTDIPDSRVYRDAWKSVTRS